MFFDLLHFESGAQAMHYFVLCLVSILGTIQVVAAHYNHRELCWFEKRAAYAFGGLAIVSSFAWFFLTDEEIFIPGLAGGELSSIFFAALLAAVPATRVIAFAFGRVSPQGALQKRAARAKDTVI